MVLGLIESRAVRIMLSACANTWTGNLDINCSIPQFLFMQHGLIIILNDLMKFI